MMDTFNQYNRDTTSRYIPMIPIEYDCDDLVELW